MTIVTFITGSSGKFEIANSILSEHGVDLVQENIDTPEVQTLDVEDVARYSVQYGVEKLQRPVMVSDAGWYIPALGGFPGPFIKFVNQTLTPENVLSMMQGVDDRRIIARECLAYCEPNKEPVTFMHELEAKISHSAEGDGFMLDKIVILGGMDKPKGCYPPEVSIEFFKQNLVMYHELAQYVKGGS